MCGIALVAPSTEPTGSFAVTSCESMLAALSCSRTFNRSGRGIAKCLSRASETFGVFAQSAGDFGVESRAYLAAVLARCRTTGCPCFSMPTVYYRRRAMIEARRLLSIISHANTMMHESAAATANGRRHIIKALLLRWPSQTNDQIDLTKESHRDIRPLVRHHVVVFERERGRYGYGYEAL